MSLVISLGLMGCKVYYSRTVKQTVVKKEPRSATKLREGVANALKERNQ